MPVRPLPLRPDLGHLKYQARDLLKDVAARDLGAAQRFREFHPRFFQATDAEIFEAHLQLSDAQLTIARESGFQSWPRLKEHIQKPSPPEQLDLPHHKRIEDPIFRLGVELLDAGDVPGLQLHLQQHPDLTRRRVVFEGGNYFRNPTLLEFAAENPIRHGKLPANIVEVAKVILDAGAEFSAINETLGLVATGRVVRECKVQLALIDLLCAYGADATSALHGAVSHGERDAVNALIRHGAKVDLPVAAALGNMDDVRRLLPSAPSRERHIALALASQSGEVEIVRSLLDAGEDPNRYNPVGCHAHSTPLHQAALAGHLDVVRLLVERGARLDFKDILWHGTPAGWAKYKGRKEVEAFLLAQDIENKQK
jgi:Ankyrin repeats (3 copies)